MLKSDFKGTKGGQKNKSLDFELAPYLCPFSLLSWFQKHKDQLWTHLGSACFGAAIYGPESAQNTKDMAKFSELICFDHNFLPNAVSKRWYLLKNSGARIVI